MNEPRFRREVWFTQLAGELDALMTRAEGLGPHLERLGDRLLEGLEFYDRRIAELTAEAQANAMTYIVRRTKETADASVREHVLSMDQAVEQKVVPRLIRLTEAVDAAADRASRSRSRAWLLQGAIALGAAVLASLTTALTFIAVMPLPGK